MKRSQVAALKPSLNSVDNALAALVRTQHKDFKVRKQEWAVIRIQAVFCGFLLSNGVDEHHTILYTVLYSVYMGLVSYYNMTDDDGRNCFKVFGVVCYYRRGTRSTCG
ncbi:hypothetical protein FF2_024547 [Malus domestica]